jgi:hypothetical protein
MRVQLYVLLRIMRVLCLWVMAQTAVVGAIHETEQDLIKRYGVVKNRTPERIHAQGRSYTVGENLHFQTDDWHIRALLIEGRCEKIHYNKAGNWSEAQIRHLLGINRGQTQWAEQKTPNPSLRREWLRHENTRAVWQKAMHGFVVTTAMVERATHAAQSLAAKQAAQLPDFSPKPLPAKVEPPPAARVPTNIPKTNYGITPATNPDTSLQTMAGAMMAGGLLVGLLSLLASLAIFVLFLCALISCLRTQADKEKITWVLVIILVPLIGPILYFVMAKRSGQPPSGPNPPPLAPGPAKPASPVVNPGGQGFDHGSVHDEKQRAAAINQALRGLGTTKRKDNPQR